MNRGPIMSDEPLLNFKEALDYLRVSRSTLYRLMHSGQVKGHKVGANWRFYASELRACVRDAEKVVRV